MLIDRGVEERVINHWDHRIELGTSSVVGPLYSPKTESRTLSCKQSSNTVG